MNIQPKLLPSVEYLATIKIQTDFKEGVEITEQAADIRRVLRN